MHDAPDPASPVRYRAEPGVVGRISRCADGWCQMDVGRKSGFIRAEHFWGADRNESLD
jgi:SH3-like domain-containing protein